MEREIGEEIVDGLVSETEVTDEDGAGVEAEESIVSGVPDPRVADQDRAIKRAILNAGAGGLVLNPTIISLFDRKDFLDPSSLSIRLSYVITRAMLFRCHWCGSSVEAGNKARVCEGGCEIFRARWYLCRMCEESFHLKAGGMGTGKRKDGVPVGYCPSCLEIVRVEGKSQAKRR